MEEKKQRYKSCRVHLSEVKDMRKLGRGQQESRVFP